MESITNVNQLPARGAIPSTECIIRSHVYADDSMSSAKNDARTSSCLGFIWDIFATPYRVICRIYAYFFPSAPVDPLLQKLLNDPHSLAKDMVDTTTADQRKQFEALKKLGAPADKFEQFQRALLDERQRVAKWNRADIIKQMITNPTLAILQAQYEAPWDFSEALQFADILCHPRELRRFFVEYLHEHPDDLTNNSGPVGSHNFPDFKDIISPVNFATYAGLIKTDPGQAAVNFCDDFESWILALNSWNADSELSEGEQVAFLEAVNRRASQLHVNMDICIMFPRLEKGLYKLFVDMDLYHQGSTVEISEFLEAMELNPHGAAKKYKYNLSRVAEAIKGKITEETQLKALSEFFFQLMRYYSGNFWPANAEIFKNDYPVQVNAAIQRMKDGRH